MRAGAGEAGRRGDSVGRYMCGDLDCSLYVRGVRQTVGGGGPEESLTREEKIARIHNNVIVGGYIGQLVATDNSSAMVVADLLEFDPMNKKKLDYLDLAAKLETDVRGKLETPEFDIQIKMPNIQRRMSLFVTSEAVDEAPRAAGG